MAPKHCPYGGRVLLWRLNKLINKIYFISNSDKHETKSSMVGMGGMETAILSSVLGRNGGERQGQLRGWYLGPVSEAWTET